MGVAASERGQATVEYALVLLAFLSLVVGLAAIWGAARDGRLQQIARDAASHDAQEGMSADFLCDLLAY